MGNVIMKAQQIAYGASNVEKALDDLKAPELIELNKRMAAIDAWKANVHEETFTGSELTIENALALPARSLITEINAIQDLHGQSAPYVGGAGKNLYGGTLSTIFDFPRILATGTVISISLDKTGEGNVTMNLYKANETTRYDFFTLSGTGRVSRTVTLIGDTARVMFYADSGVTAENIQIEVGSSATSFAPYSNICPISGRDRVVVDDTGINLFDKDHVSSFAGFIDTATNTYKSNSAYKLCYIPCEGNTTYTISKVAGKTFRVASSVGIPAADVSFINTAANHTGATLTFTTAADAHYLAVLYWSSANGDTLTPEQIEATLQIEIGSTATPYEPYAHSSATIQLGTTVYGAEINWDTGVMTVKTAKIDLGSLDYLTATVGSVTFYYADVPNAPYRDYTAICSNYPVTNDETEFFANDGIARAYGTTSYGGFARVGIIDSRYNGYTTAQFKEAMSGVDYEYELATPTTIQLTPEQLEMLKGYNRITLSDGYGTIELKALTGANWS